MTKPDQDSKGASPSGAPEAAAPAGAARRGGTARTVGAVILATVAGAAAGALALYGMNALPGNAPAPAPAPISAASAVPAVAGDATCAGAVARARDLDRFATGDLAALKFATEPRRLPPLSFADGTGETVTLAQHAGKVLLVNLWATWCVPCRKEMPALDALQAALGGPDFEVVAINLDTRDPDKPKAFLRDVGVGNLSYYADPATKTFQTLRSVGRGFGLPTTLLVDRDGCELAHLAGPAEWGGDEARALIEATLAGGAGGRP